MDLLEYQAKDLFRQMGIPVLPSRCIDHPTQVKELKIPYPIVLKSQVHASARGKAGGIRFVENTIDAVAAAQTLFRLPIRDEYPRVLLAEAKYDSDRELYLAVVLDTSMRRPLLLGSQRGGVDVEAKPDQIQQVVVDQEFSPFYARRLALSMGLSGSLIQAVSAVIEKMYWLFVERDLDLVEINPLAVSTTGELMALDGKMIVNDAALGRQTGLSTLAATTPATPIAAPPACGLRLVSLAGEIGVLCNGAGLTMATLDLIQQAKGTAANFVDLGGEYRHCHPQVVWPEQIEQGLDLIRRDPQVKVIVVNLLGGVTSCLQIAEAIASYVMWHQSNPSSPPLVVRLVGEQFHAARERLTGLGVVVFDQLDQAIAHAVALTQAEPPVLLWAASA